MTDKEIEPTKWAAEALLRAIAASGESVFDISDAVPAVARFTGSKLMDV